MSKEEQEFRFKMGLIMVAMKRKLLGKIPRKLLLVLDSDEQASLIRGLLERPSPLTGTVEK